MRPASWKVLLMLSEIRLLGTAEVKLDSVSWEARTSLPKVHPLRNRQKTKANPA